MRDVKEIAAEMRLASSVNQDPFMATYLRVWAEELEKLASAEPWKVPPKWKLVPAKADLQMIKAGCMVKPAADSWSEGWVGVLHDVWDAMIAVVPEHVHKIQPTIAEISQVIGNALSASKCNPTKPRIESAHDVREILRAVFPDWH